MPFALLLADSVSLLLAPASSQTTPPDRHADAAVDEPSRGSAARFQIQDHRTGDPLEVHEP